MMSFSSPLIEGTIVGFGDPLLDITAEVDFHFLNKFYLRENDAILTSVQQKDLAECICKEYTTRFTAGGSVQNSLRVFQWILRQPRISVMIGAVGQDKFGRYLEQNARECGIDLRYRYASDEKTGTCCVLLTKHGINRSLVTTKGASNKYSIEHLDSVWDVVERAKFFYSSSYFLSGNLESLIKVATHSRTKGKVFCLNLSAPFLMSACRKQLFAILPYVDILFGNSGELDAFVEANSDQGEITINNTITEKAKFMSKILNGSSSRLVVITNGNEPVIVSKDDEVHTYPIEEIDPDKVVDTNGAGDAFVGGFLAFLIRGCPLEVCVKNGCIAALAVIQENGCTTPDRSKVCFYSNRSIIEARIPSVTRRQISI